MIKRLSGIPCFFLKILISATIIVFCGIPMTTMTQDSFQIASLVMAANFTPTNPKPVIRPNDQTDFPRILLVTPDEITQGQSGQIMITGQHLTSDMRVILGNGIVTNTPTLTTDNRTMATLQITVSPSATPGIRTVIIQYRDRQLPQSARVTILPSYQSPVIRTATPSILQQGRSHTVTITGAHLRHAEGFDLGPGVTVTMPTRTDDSDSRISVTAAVSDAAAPGRRQIKIIDDRGTHDTRTFITIAEVRPIPVPSIPPASPPIINRSAPTTPPPAGIIPQNPPPLPPPAIQNTPRLELSLMTPHRWYPGNEYEITLQGMEMTPGMMLNLGKDVQIKNMDIKNSSLAKIKIAVGKNATPGIRSLEFKSDKNQKWVLSNLSGLVIEPVKPTRATALKPVIPLPDLTIPKGEIVLATPMFGDVWIMENAWRDVGVPTSNDAISFTWEEKQVGTSQWFEIRILDRNGKILITRKIEGSPLPENFYEPDVDFIMEIFSKFRPQSKPIVSGQVQMISTIPAKQMEVTSKPDFTILTDNGSNPYPSDDEQYIADNWDSISCFWQVAGFKKFSSGSVVEVAISDRWPLKLPEYSPTGLICSKANTQLDYTKLYDNQGEAVEVYNIYVGDKIQLSGNFTLDGCPWAISYRGDWEEGASSSSGPTVYTRTGFQFNNIFVDWGDGSYDAVYAVPDYTEKRWGEGTSTPNDASYPPHGTIKLAMTHIYRYAQKFPIRVFVLPEDDVGLIESICQANRSQKGETAPDITMNNDSRPYDQKQILLAASNTIISDIPMPVMESAAATAKIATPEPGYFFAAQGFQAPGSQAFLIYCEPKIIDVKPDPAATGDVHLISLTIKGFSGQTAPSGPGSAVSHELSSDITSKPHSEGIVPQTSQIISSVPASSMTTSGSQAYQVDPASIVSGFRPSADAVASTCDSALVATAELEYYGQKGRVILVWKINGHEIYRTIEDVGPSPIRTELDEDFQYTEPIKHGLVNFRSPDLPLDIQNKLYMVYELTAEAFVEGYETIPAQIGSHTLPDGTVIQGPPPIEYHKYVQRSALPKTYLVEKPTSGTPCAFNFPVADGKFFVVSNLQGRVTKNQGKYSGQGTLYFQLPDSSSSMATHYVDIHFSNWEAPDDVLVTNGILDVTNLNIPLDNLPGMTATLKSLKGSANMGMEAVMDVIVKDTGIHMVGAGSLPPSWPGIKGDLIPDDGWYADGKSMPLTAIYWSDFHIESNDVRIDLSRLRGEYPFGNSSPGSASVTLPAPFQLSLPSGPSNTSIPKGNPKPKTTGTYALSQTGSTPELTRTGSQINPMIFAWAGIHLGHADLYPYLFDLSEDSIPVDGWNITDSGVKGHSEFKHFAYVLGDGKISFDNIKITAGDHNLDALYENVEVHIPWPKLVLSGGNASLNYGPEGDNYKLGFNFNTQGLSVTENYGNVSMTTKINSFDRMGSGWGISTDTSFNFTDGRNYFATAQLDDLFFSVYGVAHFKGSGNDVHKRKLPLSLATTLGDTGINVFGVNVNAVGDMSKKERMFFTFNGDISFEGLNTAGVDIYYSIIKPPGDPFQGIGPSHSEIIVSTNYPNGSSDLHALTHIDVHPVITLPDSTNVAENIEFHPPLLPSFFVSDAWADSGPKDTFRGEIDTKMFNIPVDVKAKFRYGKYNGNSYWLTHINSPLFVMLYPPGVYLKAINGGIAHGFPEDVFAGNPMTATPDNRKKTLYSAGLTVGSADGIVYKLTGQMTVQPDEGIYRMDFKDVVLFGWNAGLKGGFRYSDQIFTGKVFGDFSLYNGAISCQIPDTPGEQQVGLHFGESKWEIWAGRKTNPVAINLLKTANVQGYLEFGYPTGYKVGGGIHVGTGKKCFAGLFAGELSASTNMGMAITLSQLSGTFGISANAGYWVPCGGGAISGSMGASANIDVSAPPISMSIYTDLDLPWCPGVPDSIHIEFDI